MNSMNSMNSVTVMVPMTIRRRGGRKQIIGPDGAPPRTASDTIETGAVQALVEVMARAFRWRRMLEGRRYASIRDLAAKEGVDRTYVSRVLNVTLLAPDVVEAIMDGRASEGVKLAAISKERWYHWTKRPAADGQCDVLGGPDRSETDDNLPLGGHDVR